MPRRSFPIALSRVALTVALALVTLVVVAPQASAVQCAYDTANRALAITTTNADGAAINVAASGAYLEVEDVFCALLTEVNTVTIDVSARPDVHVYFSLLGGPLGPGFTNEGNGSSEIEFTVNGFNAQSRLTVLGTTGPDKVTLGWLFDPVTGISRGALNLNAFADGTTPDNDIILGTFPGSMRVLGSNGADVISGAGTGTFQSRPNFVPLYLEGGLGANQMTGGYGDDTIVFSEEYQPDGPDTLSGGAGGIDTARAFTSTNAQSTRGAISLDGIANDGSRCPGLSCNGDNVAADFERVLGSGASEIITGNDAAQHLSGGGGNDVVQGFGGNDTFTCETGDYEGGGGNDIIQTSEARAAGQCGILRGGPGTDTADFQYSGAAVAVTIDNLSNDGPVGATTNVRTDIERVIGSAYNDSLTGSNNGDVLTGLAGNDQLLGGGGEDTLVPGPGIDTVGGGPGLDRLSYAASTVAVIVQVASKLVTGEGDDTYASVESFVGSPLGDTMNGAGSADSFTGGPGNDGLYGFGGDDTLRGGDGDDTLNGGNGTDTCSQGAGTGPVLNCEL